MLVYQRVYLLVVNHGSVGPVGSSQSEFGTSTETSNNLGADDPMEPGSALKFRHDCISPLQIIQEMIEQITVFHGIVHPNENLIESFCLVSLPMNAISLPICIFPINCISCDLDSIHQFGDKVVLGYVIEIVFPDYQRTSQQQLNDSPPTNFRKILKIRRFA